MAVADVAANLAVVRERITRAGGDAGRITIVAVTKGFGAEAVRDALAAGLVDVGENYAQELRAKAEALTGAEPRWHLLGHVQRNKVRSVAALVHLWQGVDRRAAGAEIAARSPGAHVLVQVNLGDEPQKSGCRFEEAPGVVDQLRDAALDVRGLMGIGPAGRPEGSRGGFRRLRELSDRLGLAEVSMGMTDDLEVAVQEGSTMVRIGRALFGPRPDPAGVQGLQ
jgi:PLP dependent protein